MKDKFITFTASDGKDRIMHLRKPVFCIKVVDLYAAVSESHTFQTKDESIRLSIEEKWHEAPQSKFKFIMGKAASFYHKYRPSNEGSKED